MKKILLFLLMGLMFAGIASAYCYQETANVSTVCGGLATGSYAFNVAAGHVVWTNQQNVYDGDWGTFGVSSFPGTGSDYVVNYTKPLNATNASIMWRNNIESGNWTIPSSCFSAFPTILSIYVGSGNDGTLSCLNSSGTYNTIRQTTGGNQIYEEGIFWGQTATEGWSKIKVCDSGYYIYPYMNFTFKDEETGATINSTMDGTVMDDGYNASTNTNTTASNSISFCSYSNSLTFNVSIYAPYSFTSYPQRIYQTTLSLNSTVTNKVLYLLSSSSGQYVTFQLINAADQPLEDVFVVINKSISGTQTIISSGYTGADGGITFWLNPDDQYKISAYLSPYPSYSTTQAFTQDSYTITLGSSSSANVSDYNKGMSYSFTPTDEWLSNDTAYTFNFSLTSSYWALQEFGFNITNGTYSFLNRTNSTSSTGGSTAFSMNTGQNKTLIVTYYWIVNNVTTKFVKTYRILDFSQNQYSITRLLSDFSSYSSSGFFGLTELGKGLIIFFIIVGTVGAAKIKFGISDESTLVGLLFATVAFFDVGLGLIPNPVGAVSHFPSIVIAIIFLGFAIKEMRQ